MKSTIAILALSSTVALNGAIIIDVTTSPSGFLAPAVPILDHDGELLDPGNRVLVGTFDLNPLVDGIQSENPEEFFGTNQGDLVSLFNSFIPISDDFSLDRVGNRETVLYEPGLFSTNLTVRFPALPVPEESAISAAPIYMFIVGTNDSRPEIDAEYDEFGNLIKITNIVSHGVFSSANTNWTLTDSGTISTITLRTEQIGQFYISGQVSGVPDLSLALIPEPSTFTLAMGLLAFAFGMRRRR